MLHINERESRMQQYDSKYFARIPPTTLGGLVQKDNIQLFQNMGVLHIKLK